MSKNDRHNRPPDEYPTPWASTPQPAYPTKQDAEGPFANPTYTIPSQLPSKELLGYWSTSGFTIPEPGVGNTGVWNSPIFDLRPDLKAVTGTSPQNTQPIRRAGSSGAGIRLMVQISITAGDLNVAGSQLAARGQTIDAVELGHLIHPQRLMVLCQPQSLTSDVFSGGQSVILSWEPPANPIRYWRVQLQFGQTIAGAVIANCNLSAACY